jgi:hypothetical protein
MAKAEKKFLAPQLPFKCGEALKYIYHPLLLFFAISVSKPCTSQPYYYYAGNGKCDSEVPMCG